MSDEIDTYTGGQMPEVGDEVVSQTSSKGLIDGKIYTVLHVVNESRVVVQDGDNQLLEWADRFRLISRKLSHDVAVK